MKQDDIFRSLDIFKIVEARHSTRTFSEELPKRRALEMLRAYLENAETPFGSDVRLSLVDLNETPGLLTSAKETYGVVRGARYVIAAAVPETADFALVQVGYAVERAVLLATALGLASCIVGGTFRREKLADALRLAEGEILPVVVPIGCEAEKSSLLDRLTRRAAKSTQRAELEDISFEGDFDHPINHISAGKLYPALEAVRLAPSARNRQPWRVLRDGKRVHFYKDTSCGRGSGYDMQEIDMGIAMCHFALAAADDGNAGSFSWKTPYIEAAPDCDYVATWRPDSAERPIFTVEIPDEEETSGGEV